LIAVRRAPNWLVFVCGRGSKIARKESEADGVVFVYDYVSSTRITETDSPQNADMPCRM
jgi:hypothetical protein